MDKLTTGSSARYVGLDRAGVLITGEVLEEGDIVLIHRVTDAISGTFYTVSLPSEEYGTGRTYSAWSVEASELEVIRA